MSSVSVVMPVRDGEPFLAEAIGSVCGQTAAPDEILIVDDGSTDGTQRLARGCARVTLAVNPVSIGVAASLNRGIAATHSDLIARMDADDVSRPTRIEKQVRFLAEHPGIHIVGTSYRILSADGAKGRCIRMPRGRVAVYFVSFLRPPFLHPSVLLRRSILDDQDGPYRSAAEPCEDFELWSRLLDRYDGDNIGSCEIEYRVHPGSTSVAKVALQVAVSKRLALSALARRGVQADPDAMDLAMELLRVSRRISAREAVKLAGLLLQLLDHAYDRFDGIGSTEAIAAAFECLRIWASLAKRVARAQPHLVPALAVLSARVGLCALMAASRGMTRRQLVPKEARS